MKYTKAGVFQFSNTNIECIRNCITFLGGRREGEGLKGSLSRDFNFRFFSQISFTLSPECSIGVISNVLQKFTEIFKTLFLSLVLTTLVISCSLVSTMPAIYYCYLSLVSLTPVIKPCSRFLWIPFVKNPEVKNFVSEVSLSTAITVKSPYKAGSKSNMLFYVL
jgi:hypothetical protein